MMRESAKERNAAKRPASALAAGAVVLAVLMACGGFATEAHAYYDVTIGEVSAAGAWTGNVWTPSGNGSTVAASEIEARLGSAPVTITTGNSGDGSAEAGNLTVNTGVAWSANALTLNAANNIDINAPLTGTGLVALALEYGQGAAAAGNPALYRINVPVKFGAFPSTDHTPHMLAKRGSDGVPVGKAIPACSGRPGGCPFLKNSPATLDIEYSSTEVDVAADSTHWLFLDWRDDFPTHYPYVMGCVQGEGTFYYPRNQEQKNYFDLTGAITDLAGLLRTTTTTRFCKDFNDGPILSLLSAQDFPYGYYLKYQPVAGESGMQYNTLSVLVTGAAEANPGYKVYDYLVNVRPLGDFPETVNLPPAGNALDFDGVGDYVTVPDADALDLTTSYTIEAWINPDEFKQLGGIVSKDTIWGAGGYTLRLGMNGGFSGLNFDGMESAEGILHPGVWQHVAAVNDNGVRHLYVNGVEQPLTGAPITPVANSGPVAIGMDGDGRYFNGRIDEVRIWDTARTPTEIADAMAGTVPEDSAGLAAYYRFDQGTAEGDNTGVITLIDGTANHLDGTLTNFGLNRTVSNWVGLLVHGFCGSDHGRAMGPAPTDLCASGSASSLAGSGPWSWTCWGQHGGTTPQCDADFLTWNVTPSASAGGTISPNTPQIVADSNTVSFTVTPDPGNAIDMIGGCGGSMVTADTYTTGPITGDCAVSVDFLPAQTITVTQSAPVNAVYGSTFDVAATASSGLPVAISTSGSCSGGGAGTATITMTSGTATCTVQYNQAGDAGYAPAPEVLEETAALKAEQTLSGLSASPASGMVGDNSTLSVSGSGGSGNPVVYGSSTPAVCTVSGNTASLIGGGICTVTADQIGNADYNAASQVSLDITVSKADQAITFAPLPDRTYGDADFPISATASSGLAVSFASTTPGVCTVSGTLVSLVAPGTCSITASQGGDANYNPAVDVSRSFMVNATVTPSAGPNGSISPPGPQVVAYNTTASFTIVPATGYHVAAVAGTCGGSFTGDPADSVNGILYTTNAVTVDCTVEASFAINQYTVAAVAGPNGSLDPSMQFPQAVDHGSTTQVIFHADAGYYIVSITGCGINYVNGDQSITTWSATTPPITGDCTVTAAFAINTHQLSVMVQGKGRVTSDSGGIDCPGTCAGTYDHNTMVTLTPTPERDGKFVGWSGDADCEDGVVTMTADLICTAKFSRFEWWTFWPVIMKAAQRRQQGTTP